MVAVSEFLRVDEFNLRLGERCRQIADGLARPMHGRSPQLEGQS